LAEGVVEVESLSDSHGVDRDGSRGLGDTLDTLDNWSRVGENIPEAEGLISSSGDHLGSVGALSHAQNSHAVSSQLGGLSKGRVLPDGKLVLGISVRRNDFLASRVLGPGQLGYLRSSIDGVDACSSGDVPELDASISGTSSSGQEVSLPGAPGESLDGSSVIGEGELGGRFGHVPDVDNVVVST